MKKSAHVTVFSNNSLYSQMSCIGEIHLKGNVDIFSVCFYIEREKTW